MLTYIAARRLAQSDELRVFLAKITAGIRGIPAGNAASGRATAFWIDIISG
jgi:hypothetical protein